MNRRFTAIGARFVGMTLQHCPGEGTGGSS
jgi:hypothetical protein